MMKAMCCQPFISMRQKIQGGPPVGKNTADPSRRVQKWSEGEIKGG